MFYTIMSIFTITFKLITKVIPVYYLKKCGKYMIRQKEKN